MSEGTTGHGYKLYWMIWGVLLFFTVSMILIGESSMSTGPRALLLLLGSMVKASLIIFFFMHLRYEKSGLIIIVLVGIFFTSILMFSLPAFDGGEINQRRWFGPAGARSSSQ